VDEQVNGVIKKRLQEGHSKADDIKVSAVKFQPPELKTHSVQAIFLVGGFGSSKYLKARLEAEHPGIQIIQPHDAWAAIVR
jgi:hypothetical protein